MHDPNPILEDSSYYKSFENFTSHIKKLKQADNWMIQENKEPILVSYQHKNFSTPQYVYILTKL